MRSSPSTEPTPLKLCAIVDQWLHEHDYPLLVKHDILQCLIVASEQAGNLINIGAINEKDVVLLGDDPYNTTEISAYDTHFFEKLEKALDFTKP